MGTCDVGVEVKSFTEVVDLDKGLRGGGQRALGSLAREAEAPQGTWIRSYVHPSVLALELSHEMLHHVVVNILPAHVRVTGSGLNFINAILDAQHSRVGAAAPEVEDERVHLRGSILAQLVRNRGCRRVVDDSEYVQPWLRHA